MILDFADEPEGFFVFSPFFPPTYIKKRHILFSGFQFLAFPFDGRTINAIISFSMNIDDENIQSGANPFRAQGLSRLKSIRQFSSPRVWAMVNWGLASPGPHRPASVSAMM